jgi:3-hydroxybutyrate dehydrogenase
MTNLSGRSAIVTGGFSGMGFAIATALAEAGANVAVGSYIAPAGADRTDAAYYPGADEIKRVRSALSAHGTKVHAAHLDVRDSDVANRFAAEAEAAIGPAGLRT